MPRTPCGIATGPECGRGGPPPRKRGRATGSYKYPFLNDPDWLHRQYVEGGKTMREIGEMAGGCAPTQVWDAMNRHGIARRAANVRTGPLADAAWLRGLYEAGNSLREIGKMAGVSSPATVMKALKEIGVERRSRGWRPPRPKKGPAAELERLTGALARIRTAADALMRELARASDAPVVA